MEAKFQINFYCIDLKIRCRENHSRQRELSRQPASVSIMGELYSKGAAIFTAAKTQPNCQKNSERIFTSGKNAMYPYSSRAANMIK